MTQWELHAILDLALEAGRIGLRHYGKTASELKSDGSVVTVADRAIEQYLGQFFDCPGEGSYLLGEETLDSRDEAYIEAALAAEACWVVDPIDGTAPYTAEFPAWGISIGLVRAGEFAEGVIYLPAQGYVIVTAGDTVYHCEQVTPEMTAGEVKLTEVPRHFPHLGGAGHVGITQRYAKNARLDFSNAVFTWCSCVTPFYYIATGRLLAYFVDAKAWDVAGGFPILRRLGLLMWGMRDRRELAPRLSREFFHLDKDDPCRWCQNQVVLVAPDEAVAHYFETRVTEIKK